MYGFELPLVHPHRSQRCASNTRLLEETVVVSSRCGLDSGPLREEENGSVVCLSRGKSIRLAMGQGMVKLTLSYLFVQQPGTIKAPWVVVWGCKISLKVGIFDGRLCYSLHHELGFDWISGAVIACSVLWKTAQRTVFQRNLSDVLNVPANLRQINQGCAEQSRCSSTVRGLDISTQLEAADVVDYR